MPEISREDRELAAAAKKKAGGPAKLAVQLGLSKQAVTAYGRTRPIPRHLRPTLARFLKGEEPMFGDQDRDLYEAALRIIAKNKTAADVVVELTRSPEDRELVEDALRKAMEAQ